MRAIDAALLESKINEFVADDVNDIKNQQHREGAKYAVRRICKIIQEVPTLNVQPVVHGKWVSHTPKDPSKNFHCSNCLGTVEMPYYTYDCYYKYCPNCGAKLIGKGE